MHCIRAPPRQGRYWEIHPRRPRDFLRPERFPEGEAQGKSRGSREIWRAEGMDFPIPPEFWWSTDNLSASIFLQGVDQKILPCGQGRIDSVKINPSLLMMTDCIRAPPRRGRYWEIHPRRPKDFPRPKRFPEGEARGKSRGSREIWRAEELDFPIPPEFW